MKHFQKFQLITAHCSWYMSMYSQQGHTQNQFFMLVTWREYLTLTFCITITLHIRMWYVKCKQRCSQNAPQMASHVWVLFNIVTAHLQPIWMLTSCTVKFKTYFITAFELQYTKQTFHTQSKTSIKIFRSVNQSSTLQGKQNTYPSLVFRKTPTYGWFNFTFLLIRSINAGFVIWKK